MPGILDLYGIDPTQYPGILSLPQSAGFPDTPKQADPQAIWDAINAENAKANAAADRRNAAGLTASGNLAAPVYPLAGPDASNPAVSYAMGQTATPFGSLAGPIQGVPTTLTMPPVASPAQPQSAPAALSVAPNTVKTIPVKPSTVDDTTLPTNAAPTTGQGNPAQSGPPVPQTSLLGRIGEALKATDDKIAPHTATLLALAGGLAGAPSWGTGISRGFTAAAQALPMDQKLALQNMGIQQTFRALREQGVPPQLALASVYNPDVLKSTLQNYVTDRQWQVKTVKDMVGNERLIAFNPFTQETKDLTNGTGGVGTGGSIGALAPGVTNIDSTLTGDSYLKQFSPEVQAAVKAYMNGDVMPTGNPRQQGIANLAKTIAQKYGQDMGIPVNDSTYAAKRKLKTDLASSGNSSMGGILSNGESSFSHLAELGGSMSELGNASHDFPGGGAVAAAQNYVGNAMFPSSATKAKVKATDDNLSRYGQESTKFYAGSGGGESERMQARHDMDPAKASSEEMAAYLEKEKSLMLDRLNTKFGQIRQELGEEEGGRVIAQKMPQLEQNIARIDASIAKLRGTAAPSSPASPLVPGASTVVNGVKITRVN